MIRVISEIKFNSSQYSELYDILNDENNSWRRLNNEIDFSFVVEMLKDKYSYTLVSFYYLISNTTPRQNHPSPLV